ncbi:proteasome accessory factor PafA2 [Citricoccus sp. SGAir0253]|uniref:depupylase/deamidase Dop n=1 Tax=Citricoccus sp. SGAir0253 TaxID=2567881 RepID=UPI0010CD4EDB|nr:depupylase/deamidase Dop [Citricoccus sp. SGAir0253]QCU79387.1 proteasome accessory factor PafA2 [Citricoccus sp. SGAir0253]
MGMETEYGVHAPDNPGTGHSVLSVEVVNAYADVVTAAGGSVAGTEWDYGEESPLVDARGWQLPRSAAHPTQLTDRPLTDDDGHPVHLVMNLVLPNGARFYVDHAHPEYSAPETTNPLDAMVWDQAGDRVALAASRRIAEAPGAPQVLLYKNNTDNKSVSYGAHENYLVARSLDFDELAARLLPFFTARQVVCGAGRVGLGVTGRTPGFQVSQRADFFEEQVGLETTIRRPIVNTRDEPHADQERYRRLHVIIGDANLSQYSTWLRCGTTALVLSMIELGTCPVLELRDPVAALQAISHDPTLRATVELADGRRLTGVDLMEVHLEAAGAHVARFGMDDPATTDVLAAWRRVLDLLRTDPAALADRLDWVAKHQLLEGYRQRHGLSWDDPRLGMMDLQYADLRPERGLHHALVRRGSMRTLVPEETVLRAVDTPPSDTRAWARGRTVDVFGRHVVGASWDTLLLREDGQGPLHRFHQREPLSGTARQTAGVFDDGAAPGAFGRLVAALGAAERDGRA